MPAQKKLSAAARIAKQAEEDKYLKVLAEKAFTSDESRTSSNGTIVSGYYMKKTDGSVFVMETERRSRKHSVMKWRKLA